MIGTASLARHDLLRELGAVPVAYGPGLADRVRAVVPGGPDASLDLAGTPEAVDVSVELTRNRNRIVTIVMSPRSRELGIRTLGGGPGADPGTEVRAAARPQLAALAGEGRLRVIVAGTFPLAEAVAAHREIMAGHTTGKIALLP